MANALHMVSLVSATQTFTRCIAIAAIEDTYYKANNGYPEQFELQGRTGYAITGSPPTSLGVGYKYFVPQPIDMTTPAENFQSAASGCTTVATGIVITPAVATTSIPYIDLVIEPIAVETSPQYIFSYHELEVDMRLVTTAVGAVLDVQAPMEFNSPPLGTPGIGKYRGFRFYKPDEKSTTATDIIQLRASYPSLALASTTAPAGTFRAHISFFVLSNA